jgi:hypothetical protein
MRIPHFGRRGRTVLAIVGLLAGATGMASAAGLASAAPAAAAPAAAGTAKHAAPPPHVMTIMMENTDYSQFVGSLAMPYLNEIAHQYADFTNAYGWTYPSLPNYMELLSGTDDGLAGRDCDITDNNCSNFTNPTLVDQMEAKGISWNAYYQGDSSGCYQGDGSGNYPYWRNSFRYQSAALPPAFRPVVKAAGPQPVSGGPVLLLDVLAQDRDGGSANRPGEVGRRPQPVRPPVVAAQVRELLPHPAGGDALEGVHEPGQRHLGREVHQQVHVIGFPVELGKLAPEVRAHVPHDLLKPFQVPYGEDRMPVLSNEDQMGMQDENTVPASADVLIFSHETDYNQCGGDSWLNGELPKIMASSWYRDGGQ